MICRKHFDLHYHVMLEMQVVRQLVDCLLNVVRHSFHLLLIMICRKHFDLHYHVMLEMQVVSHELSDLSCLLNVVRHSFHLLKLDLLCRVMLEMQVVRQLVDCLLNVVRHSFHLLKLGFLLH